ncbi:acyl-CoA Delta-9 desaturase-like [Periplaneta americana]|uniref:acyl-CoA Delta-9 desaturase-like n=1 Tax=Periplaneta americana TaxID=6978 RepID=UPI0037E990AB
MVSSLGAMYLHTRSEIAATAYSSRCDEGGRFLAASVQVGITASWYGNEAVSKLLQCSNFPRKMEPKVKWINVVSIGVMHAVALATLLTITFWVRWQTILWGVFVGGVGGFGVTAGVHRLWTHRSYRARLPLRILLAICYSVAGQNTIYDWVRDHRVHHRFSETDADPHNSRRGFFFAHMGWLMQRKHPDVVRCGKLVDMSDVLEDPVVRFHQKYFTLLKVIFCFAIPVVVPSLLWAESWWYSSLGMGVVRYTIGLNFTWLVNSAAHIWGTHPYDKRIRPAESATVAILAMGEGWHNYHHVFPWDYRAAELGHYSHNVTTALIDFFWLLGWAYDLRTVSPDVVRRTVETKGDGSHPLYERNNRS